MPVKTSEGWREAGPYLSLGVQLAATVLLLLWGGKWLDEKYGTEPYWTLAGAFLGITVGLYNLIKTVNHLEKMQKKNDKSSENR
ncbi:MAG: AtpZ/AtpI family protein [Ignavibacteriales bacterium]|nr:hypothetical protein [Ignavibacteriaceae bacterium]QOJ28539.1 MAG: AtpZ/AtpI family protein [Ignavibacteriales bacterium]